MNSKGCTHAHTVCVVIITGKNECNTAAFKNENTAKSGNPDPCVQEL
jgi:hypothetical protein